MHEYITRTALNQWYAAKRDFPIEDNSSTPSSVTGADDRGAEVYAEVGNTQASLVDVQVEVDGVIRRWFGK